MVKELIVIVLLLSCSLFSQANSSMLSSQIDLISIEGDEAVVIFLPMISNWTKEFSFEDKYVKSELQQDATMAFRYTNEKDSSRVIWVAIQISRGRHMWEDSLLKEPAKRGEPGANVIEHKDLMLIEEPITNAKLFIFQRHASAQPEAILYWFVTAEFKIGELTEERNVLISLWQYTTSLENSGLISDEANAEEIEELYISFAKPIANHWKKIAEKEESTLNYDSPYLWFLAAVPLPAYFALRALPHKKRLDQASEC